MDWLLNNWEMVLGSALAAASIITRATPTPRDDALLASVLNILGRLSLLEHSDSGRSLKLPGKRTVQPPTPGEMLD